MKTFLTLLTLSSLALAQHQAYIISAEYEGGDYIDRIIIHLSEPLERTQDTDPFVYKLKSKDENATFEPIEAPNSITWANDSSVVLTYPVVERSRNDTPLPGDSVRLAGNPNEIGKKIEGRERFKKNRHSIARLDIVTAETTLQKAMERRFSNLLEGKFSPEEPITLLPIPETWQGEFLQDSINKNYPSTIGPILWPEPKFAIQDLEAKLGGPIPRDKIIFTANSIYHTSYGDYSAKSGELKITCDNQIFEIDGAKDCADSNIGIYIAWNMKDNNNRWAGAGAYLQIYNFQWEIKNVDPKINGIINRYPKKDSKKELYGVARIEKKWKLKLL